MRPPFRFCRDHHPHHRHHSVDHRPVQQQVPGRLPEWPGVGDQARAFTQPLGAGKDNEEVVATKGSTLVAITATATPATLAQVEALVKQLL